MRPQPLPPRSRRALTAPPHSAQSPHSPHSAQSPHSAHGALVALVAALALAACEGGGAGAVVDMGVAEDAVVTPAVDLGAADAGGAEGGGAGAGAQVDLDSALCAECDPSVGSAGAEGSCAPGFVCYAPEVAEGEAPPPPFCTRPCVESDETSDVSVCPSAYVCEVPRGAVSGGESPERLCAPARGSCAPVFCNDADEDGYGRGRDCLGLDCNDSDPSVHAGVSVDLCDGVDNNCDGDIDEDFEPLPCGEGVCAGVSVCDMGRARCDSAQPVGEDTSCDGLDNDCDGRSDEGYQPLSCGLGVCRQDSVCHMGDELCAPLPSSPGETDSACDGIDADCDGQVDEGFLGEVCGQGVCAARGVCTPQGLMCTPGPLLGNDADCNQLDDDCDGRADEGFMPVTRCGLGACGRAETCGAAGPSCVPAPPLSATDSTCDGVDDDCNGVIDDACAENALSFTLISQDATTLVVAIRLSRGQEQGAPNVATLPSAFDLHIRLPLGLSVASIQLGEAPRLLGITENLQDFNPDAAVVNLFFPFNRPITYDRMQPGELAVLRLNKQAGAQPPFTLSWLVGEAFTDLNGNGVCEANPPTNEPFVDANFNLQCDENTTVTPSEARRILTLNNATF